MHFRALVLLEDVDPGDRRAIENAVAEKLYFYEQEAILEPYERVCPCVNLDAMNVASRAYIAANPNHWGEVKATREEWEVLRDRIGEASGPEFGRLYAEFGKAVPTYERQGAPPATLDAFRTEEEAISERMDGLERRRLSVIVSEMEVSPLLGVPDPACDDCHGSGYIVSTGSPEPKLDWWKVGGRYSGMLDGYEPLMDPANHEKCEGCENGADSGSCSSCKGSGVRLLLPVEWVDHDGDVMLLGDLLGELDPELSFAALVTPDGNWHERRREERYGVVIGEGSSEEWRLRQRELLGACDLDGVAVIVDCCV